MHFQSCLNNLKKTAIKLSFRRQTKLTIEIFRGFWFYAIWFSGRLVMFYNKPKPSWSRKYNFYLLTLWSDVNASLEQFWSPSWVYWPVLEHKNSIVHTLFTVLNCGLNIKWLWGEKIEKYGIGVLANAKTFIVGQFGDLWAWQGSVMSVRLLQIAKYPVLW